jgi:hypothetical protein
MEKDLNRFIITDENKIITLIIKIYDYSDQNTNLNTFFEYLHDDN